jgi:hypothetical protein
MIIVYGDSKGCFTCAILKSLLPKSRLDYRFYELDEDYTLEELGELYPSFGAVPFILKNGVEITLKDLESLIL